MIDSAQEFLRLCKSGDPVDIQRTMSDSASLEVWRNIIQFYPSHCIDVAQNSTIPNEIYSILAASEDVFVRIIIGKKGRLPDELFSILATDPDERVRRVIASHRRTPLSILKNLALDSIESVASVAIFNLRKRSA